MVKIFHVAGGVPFYLPFRISVIPISDICLHPRFSGNTYLGRHGSAFSVRYLVLYAPVKYFYSSSSRFKSTFFEIIIYQCYLLLFFVNNWTFFVTDIIKPVLWITDLLHYFFFSRNTTIVVLNNESFGEFPPARNYFFGIGFAE